MKLERICAVVLAITLGLMSLMKVVQGITFLKYADDAGLLIISLAHAIFLGVIAYHILKENVQTILIVFFIGLFGLGGLFSLFEAFESSNFFVRGIGLFNVITLVVLILFPLIYMKITGKLKYFKSIKKLESEKSLMKSSVKFLSLSALFGGLVSLFIYVNELYRVGVFSSQAVLVIVGVSLLLITLALYFIRIDSYFGYFLIALLVIIFFYHLQFSDFGIDPDVDFEFLTETGRTFFAIYNLFVVAYPSVFAVALGWSGILMPIFKKFSELQKKKT